MEDPSTVPPPIIEPEHEPHRPYVWLTLGALLAALIALALAGYFTVAKPDEAQDLATKLHVYAVTQASSEFSGAPTGSAPSDLEIPAAVSDEAAHGRNAEKRLAAAELSIAAEAILHRPLSPSYMKLVSQSNKPKQVAFYRIYSAKKLSRAEADSLSNELESPPWLKVAAAAAYAKAGDSKPYLAAVGSLKPKLRIAALTLGAFIVLAGSAVWFVFLTAKSMGKLPALGHPAEPLTLGGADRYAQRSLTLVIGYLVVNLLAAPLSLIKGFPTTLVDAATGVGLVLLLPIVYLSSRDRRIRPANQGWTTANLGKNILWGIGAGFAIGPVFAIAMVIGEILFRFLPQESHPVSIQLENSPTLWTFLLIGFIASVCAPIFEETLFRGSLLPAISNRLRSVPSGIIISSFIFAGLHPTGPPSWLALASIGAISSMLMYQTRSIVPSVIMHAAFNFTQLIFVLLIT